MIKIDQLDIDFIRQISDKELNQPIDHALSQSLNTVGIRRGKAVIENLKNGLIKKEHYDKILNFFIDNGGKSFIRKRYFKDDFVCDDNGNRLVSNCLPHHADRKHYRSGVCRHCYDMGYPTDYSKVRRRVYFNRYLYNPKRRKPTTRTDYSRKMKRKTHKPVLRSTKNDWLLLFKGLDEKKIWGDEAKYIRNCLQKIDPTLRIESIWELAQKIRSKRPPLFTTYEKWYNKFLIMKGM
jgi:hypothetical protein